MREQALTDLERRVSRDPLPPPVSLESMSSEPDPVGELRSTTFLLQKALSEQVSYFCSGITAVNTFTSHLPLCDSFP